MKIYLNTGINFSIYNKMYCKLKILEVHAGYRNARKFFSSENASSYDSMVILLRLVEIIFGKIRL